MRSHPGHLAGAALDVFPREPGSSSEAFECELRGLENVILTPHIGGSTEGAQRNIGIEVASALVKYIETGSSSGAVNFPHLDLPLVRNRHGVLNIHRNVPGVLSNINRIVAEMGVNISSQYLGTRHDVGYLIMDVDQKISRVVKRRTHNLNETLSIIVYYQGLPVPTGWGSFEFGEHDGQPIIWTLSQPYGASDWFACKDTPEDKSDSAYVSITVDESLIAVSNGNLRCVVNNGDGTHTYKWNISYPIAHYLISVAITNYYEYAQYFQYSPTDSMLVIH